MQRSAASVLRFVVRKDHPLVSKAPVTLTAECRGRFATVDVAIAYGVMPQLARNEVISARLSHTSKVFGVARPV